MVRYKVTLNKEEQEELISIVSKGKHTSQVYRAAYILLNCDEGIHGNKIPNEDIAKFLRITARTVERTKQRFVEDGFEACLERKVYPEKKDKKADGDFEAHLVALSCSKAPPGYKRWNLRLLADKMVELNYVDKVSHETIRQVLKKTKLNRGK